MTAPGIPSGTRPGEQSSLRRFAGSRVGRGPLGVADPASVCITTAPKERQKIIERPSLSRDCRGRFHRRAT